MCLNEGKDMRISKIKIGGTEILLSIDSKKLLKYLHHIYYLNSIALHKNCNQQTSDLKCTKSM